MTVRLIRASLRAWVGPLAALGALAGAAQAATPADPSGTWLTEDGRARIRVERCGPAEKNLCGYVVWLKVPLNDQNQPRIDFKNPDPKKQARASLGHQLILGLKPNADARYEGKIYNSEDGKSYDVTIWTEEPNELTVRGLPDRLPVQVADLEQGDGRGAGPAHRPDERPERSPFRRGMAAQAHGDGHDRGAGRHGLDRAEARRAQARAEARRARRRPMNRRRSDAGRP